MVCHFPGRAFIPVSTAVNFSTSARQNWTQFLPALGNIQHISDFLLKCSWLGCSASQIKKNSSKNNCYWSDPMTLSHSVHLVMCACMHNSFKACHATKNVCVCVCETGQSCCSDSCGRSQASELWTWSCSEESLGVLSFYIINAHLL